MNLNYAIFRSQPIMTTHDLAQIGSHNQREKQAYNSNPDIKVEDSFKNIELVPLNSKYVKGFKEITKEYEKQHNEKQKTERKERQRSYTQMLNQSRNCVADELLFTASPKFFENMSNEDLMKWANSCMEFVYEDLGYKKEQVLHSTIHLDEKTPHIHCVVVPLVKKFDKRTNTERYTISKKQFIKDKIHLSQLQDKYHARLTEKGFDLERGKENTDREHIATDDMKKLTNFYNIKQLKENLTKQKEQMISYKDIQDFYKYEDFTKDNVDKKLIYPILKYNNSLIKQNHDLLLELSKVKNVKKYYSELQIENNQILNKNQELEEKLKMNSIELNACYNIIKELLDKNKKIERILKDKLGIEIINHKDNDINSLNK